MNTSADRDERLAAALAALTERLDSGRSPDVEAAARDDPEIADELRSLWAAAVVADLVGRSVSTDADETLPLGRAAAGEASFADLPDGPRIELLQELGRGGMGVVYLGVDRALGRDVAVKRLIRGASATAADVARLKAEAQAAAALTHPNVVRLFGVESLDGQPCLVMEYIEGTTLAQRLAGGPLPDREAAALLAPVARAVAYLHGRGVLHRDLKPSNILIDREGCPRVSDFGLAKRVGAGESLTQSGAVLGTPGYIAPEQASGARGPIGPAADVYGLGAVLYHMLTGRPPFQAANPLDTVLMVLDQEPVPPRILNPKASPDLETVALKCLSKDPALRYRSAAAVADDLEAFLRGDAVSARTLSLRGAAGRLLGETHLAPLVENWGALWMLHAVALLAFFGLTEWWHLRGVTARWPYVLLFTAGLGAWAAFFWSLRRRGGPISFGERLLAHVWGSGIVSINLTFLVEWLLGLPVLTLLPMFAVSNGALLMVKGGILSGDFYLQAAAVFLTVFPMAWYPRWAPLIFAPVAAACFFLKGLRAHLRWRRTARLTRAAGGDDPAG